MLIDTSDLLKCIIVDIDILFHLKPLYIIGTSMSVDTPDLSFVALTAAFTGQ